MKISDLRIQSSPPANSFTLFRRQRIPFPIVPFPALRPGSLSFFSYDSSLVVMTQVRDADTPSKCILPNIFGV
jgi:hypothetical protein